MVIITTITTITIITIKITIIILIMTIMQYVLGLTMSQPPSATIPSLNQLNQL